MKLTHPLYGGMKVPDNRDEIQQELKLTRSILEETYIPVVLAYQDMLESALDLHRRGEDAV